MGAQEFAGVEIECIFFVTSGVIGGGVEGVEAMVFIFDFRAIGEGEAHAAQDLDRFIADQGEGVEAASGKRTGGKSEVDSGERGGIGDGLDGGLLFLKRGGDGGAGSVERLAEGGFFFVGDVLDQGSGEGERAFFSENRDAGVIEGARIGSGGDEFKGGRLDGCDLLVHGRARG